MEAGEVLLFFCHSASREANLLVPSGSAGFGFENHELLELNDALGLYTEGGGSSLVLLGSTNTHPKTYPLGY